MIRIDQERKIYTIHTENTTYQMKEDELGYLIHIYYGRRTEGCMDYLLTFRDRGFSGNPYDAERDRTYSHDALPMEFPFQGTGDCRSPVFVVEDAAACRGCDLKVSRSRVRAGKYRLKGLPAVHASDKAGADDYAEAETLEIVLRDDRLGLEVTLLYGVLPHIDVITRAAIVRNDGGDIFTVRRAQTACLDFVNGDYDVTIFRGRHTKERMPDRQSVTAGRTVIGSRRGNSSHQYNPMMILQDRTTTETAGRCWSMQFVYSGSFEAEVERDQYDQTRMIMGMEYESFGYPLAAGEELVLPEVIMSYSGEGLGKLSRNLHSCIRDHVVRGPWSHRVRPVLLNSWESAYFDFTGETIIDLAREAKALGIEMVVMDDGWFGKRDDDYSGLGDWTPNEKKLGGSLRELIDAVHAEGVRFGIWMEPEMVNEDSDLYRAHPDWAYVGPAGKPMRARYQLPLDLSKPEVADYIYQQICAVLDTGDIDYLKWDCNRNITDVYSAAGHTPGHVLYDYYIGLYGILDRLNERYPNLLIEGCSGGGGRFDAGMLYYTPQIWCSDNTDAVERLHIQYGTSFGYPASTVGAHVSKCPNEQTGRTTPIDTRAAVAMAGTFGYELNPAKLDEDDRDAICDQITHYKKYASLVQQGEYYRLSDPERDAICAWAFVRPDGSEALLTAVMQEIHSNMPTQYVRPQGLTSGAMYDVTLPDGDVRTWPANALMEFGFPLPDVRGEYRSFVIHFTRK